MNDAPVIAGIELGGTKSVALIARDDVIIDTLRIPTGTPEVTLRVLSDQLARWAQRHPVAALGIGSFGPLALDRNARDFGRITATPKPHWSNIDVRGHFAAALALPTAFDTDVAGAALAEERWGASGGCRVHAYLTIGTGIGAGIVVDGRPVHGLVHPEIGHIRIRRSAGDTFAGICPFHGDCLEGLAAGPAIAARAGAPAETLTPDDPVWRLVANDIAELMAMLILTVSPERILIGGGVGQNHPALLGMVRETTARLLGGYVAGLTPATINGIIRNPALGDRAGPLGAIALGRQALEDAGG